jgi:hypothetical protein
MATDAPEKYWYNSRTGEVELGMLSPNTDRVGPFASRAEAEAAPALIRARAEAWAQEEAEDD